MYLEEIINGFYDLEEYSGNSETGLQDNLRILYKCKKKTGRHPVIFYIVECSVCKEDKELHGDGLFACQAGHLRKGIFPCGCGKNVRWTANQYALLIDRRVGVHGYEFIGYRSDGCIAQNNKVYLWCGAHETIFKKSVQQVINTSKRTFCPRCKLERLQDLNRKDDAEMISDFLATGAFHEKTIFKRIDRKSKAGKRVYWSVECPICGEYGESASSDLKAGKICCGCGTHRQRYAYLMLVMDGETVVSIKFGISSNPTRRLPSIFNSTIYEIELIKVWQFETVEKCREAERYCKELLPCGVISKTEMRNGHTETLPVGFIDDVCKIFADYGGVVVEDFEGLSLTRH